MISQECDLEYSPDEDLDYGKWEYLLDSWVFGDDSGAGGMGYGFPRNIDGSGGASLPPPLNAVGSLP